MLRRRDAGERPAGWPDRASPGASNRRSARVRMIAARWSPPPRLFFTAVGGAAVFALCTVAVERGRAVGHRPRHRPRFEEGEVAVGVVTGVALVIGIGVVRAAGVVVRRTWAGKAQWRIAETARRRVVDRLCASRSRGTSAGRRRSRRPRRRRHRRGSRGARAGPVRHRHRADDRRVGDLAARHRPRCSGAFAVLLFPVLAGMNVVYQRRVDRHFEAPSPTSASCRRPSTRASTACSW